MLVLIENYGHIHINELLSVKNTINRHDQTNPAHHGNPDKHWVCRDFA